MRAFNAADTGLYLTSGAITQPQTGRTANVHSSWAYSLIPSFLWQGGHALCDMTVDRIMHMHSRYWRGSGS